MGRRTLSEKQKDRIQANRLKSGVVGDDNLSINTGRVISRVAEEAVVEFQGPAGLEQRHCHLRANLHVKGVDTTLLNHQDGIVTGDFVRWQPLPDHLQDSKLRISSVVTSVLPRRSVLLRPDNRGKLRLMASNIDYVCIVLAPLPEPHLNLVDRYICATEAQQLKPALVLNKTDLLDKIEKSSLLEQLDIYRTLGYPVLPVSAKTGEGIEHLNNVLSSNSSIFVGQSGVGKSSLLKRICPAFDDQIGELSAAKSHKSKGKHTTTKSILYHLPNGGTVIDSPGIREFGLWHLDRASIGAGFREIQEYAAKCKFRDCSHQNEPGCAVVAAVVEGKISAQRFSSFQHILAGLASP